MLQPGSGQGNDRQRNGKLEQFQKSVADGVSRRYSGLRKTVAAAIENVLVLLLVLVLDFFGSLSRTRTTN
jgi:hypothetical protein